MYRFQVKAPTRQGEVVGITGSIPELGAWNPQKYVPLHTSGDRYPMWHLELDLSAQSEQQLEHRIEYKYVRVAADGEVQWETAGGKNRWVPLEHEYLHSHQPTLIVDDGSFGITPAYPYGYIDQQSLPLGQPQSVSTGLKVLVIGSSVAMGCSAWLLKGWAHQLAQALEQKYGYHLINRSQLGANVSSTIERFASVVVPEKPDVVVIALSLGNEGLAYCRPHDRRAVQRRFESGLLQLIQMTRDLGAVPIIGGLYPHDDYSPDHSWLMRDTHARMQQWNVPILDWLDILDNGAGRWQPDLGLDVAHPNSWGHQKMFEAIALDMFAPEQIKSKLIPKQSQVIEQLSSYQVVYKDKYGFEIWVDNQAQTLRIINQSSDLYDINPTWQDLQASLQLKSKLASGTYLAKNDELGLLPLLSITPTGTISNHAVIPIGADLQYCSALKFFAPQVAQILYYDGHIGVLKEGDRTIRIVNESDENYNLHPMWKEMRAALAAMPAGVYHDPVAPDAPFRTMMIGDRGLESRVKAPAKSTMILQYKCKLSEIARIAILPLGDRCAARMLLYKMEYDGPAFPFDLTRSTNLGDVADMVANGFEDMWNPIYLHYSDSERRIYHSKWSGLSFGHEVEDDEDPLHNMQPILERMRSRYSARARRFLYTIDHADEILFVRTGVTNRGYVLDLMDKLTTKCKGKPFRVLLISQQDSTEFANIPQLIHYDLHFSPDWMYDSQDYWWECTRKMKEILESLGVSSQNLFWCPPNP